MAAEMIKSVQRVTIFCFCALAVLIVGWLFTLHHFLAGLGIGLLLGWIILLHLAWRVVRFGQLASPKKRRPRMGSMTRLAIAGLGAVVAVTYPEHVHYIGLVVGLMVPMAFLLGEALVLHFKELRKG
jgi:ATP synthase protein I